MPSKPVGMKSLQDIEKLLKAGKLNKVQAVREVYQHPEHHSLEKATEIVMSWDNETIPKYIKQVERARLLLRQGLILQADDILAEVVKGEK